MTNITTGDVARAYPAADIQHLRQLRRNALKEAEQGKPPRAFREIFRVLRQLEHGSAAETDSDIEEEFDDDE